MAPTPWSLKWNLCVVGECTHEDNAHQVYAVHVYVHQSNTDRSYSHYWRQTEYHLTLSRHQISHPWRCSDVSGSIARGTRDLSPAASRRFPMSLDDAAGATCARISSQDAVRAVTAARTMRRSWRASVLRGRPEPDLWLWECSINNCWKQRHTTDALCSNQSLLQLQAMLWQEKQHCR